MSVTAHLFGPRGAPVVSLNGARLLREAAANRRFVEAACADLGTALDGDDVAGCTTAIRQLLGISLHLREYANLAEELRT